MHPQDRPEQKIFQFVETTSPFRSLISSISGLVDDTIHPRRIQMTATPVAVEEMWSRHSVALPMLMSSLIYAGLITLVLIPWAVLPKLPDIQGTEVLLSSPPPLLLDLPKDSGHGGGGKLRPTPASFGVLPRADVIQFVPPTVEEPKNLRPLVAMEPTLVTADLVQPQMFTLFNIGNPLSFPGLPPSDGTGKGGGLGEGDGHGVGDDIGTSFGNNPAGRNIQSPGPNRVGVDGVSEPKCVPVQPEYSEEARKAHLQGTVVLSTIVKKDGTIQVDRVVQKLGMGLDDNAVATARTWKCSPAMKNGMPVDVPLNIQVKFTLR